MFLNFSRFFLNIGLLVSLTGELIQALQQQEEQSPLSCPPQLNWTINDAGQNPCQVAGFLLSLCNPIPVIVSNPGQSGFQATPQFAGGINQCVCNTVTYSLLSECATCIGIPTTGWNFFSQNCNMTTLSSFPISIPSNISVPTWAKQNITNDMYDPSLAKSNATSSSTSSTGSTSSSASAASSKMNDSMKLALGLSIGVTLFSLIAGGVAFFFIQRLRKRRTGESAYHSVDPFNLPPTVSSGGDGKVLFDADRNATTTSLATTGERREEEKALLD